MEGIIEMKKLLSIVLVIVLLSISILVLPVVSFASEDDQLNMNLDVMFVIDGSGSMCVSDPKGIAKEACKLFTNMCDYEKARAGYIVFSGEIRDSYPLASLNDSISREKFIKSLGSIKYPSYAITDISLGLTSAMNVLINNGSMSGERSPMIILLSDGKTEDISTQRKEVYDAEFADTLKYLEEHNVPVYTIALNATGAADVATLSNIAETTNALTFETKSADDLPSILSEILAHQLKSNMEKVSQFTGSGKAETIKFNIPNDGIVQANVIILSTKGAQNIHLAEPSGNEVVIPSKNVSYSKSNCYQLIKINRPTKGDWTLTLTGVDKDLVTVNLINNYDVLMQLKSNKSSIKNNESATFSLYCSNVTDSTDMFKGAEAVLTVANASNGEQKNYDMTWSGNEMSASVAFNEPGNYKVSAKFVAKDGDYERDTNVLDFTVEPAKLAFLNDENQTQTITLLSKFLFFKIGNTKKISLSSIVTQDASAETKAVFIPGGFEDVCDAEFDAENGNIVLTATKTGSGTLKANIVDNFGQSVDYTAQIKVIPGFLLFLAIIVLLAVFAGVVILIKLKSMPMLKGSMMLSVALPEVMSSQTPPESEYNLGALSKKGKVSLSEIISSNMTTSGQYLSVLVTVMEFVNNVKFEAANSEGTNMWIYLPASSKSGQVLYNNMPLEKDLKQSVSLNLPTTFSYAGFDGTYRFTITYKNGGFGGVSSFGGNFGNDNSGFGSNEGFGSFGSGTQDVGSGSFGSFDGGNSQGFGNNSAGGFGNFGGDDNGFGSF